MKILTVVFAMCLFAPGAIGQTIRHAESLSPKDIGATKLSFEAQAAPGQVVVFRRDKYTDGKLVQRYDVVSNQRDKMQAHHVMLLDLSFLSGGRSAGYTLKSPVLSAVNIKEAELRSESYSENPPTADFEFEGATGAKSVKQKFVFTIFSEPYDEAKRRIPELPADTTNPNSWWSYLHRVDVSKL